MATKMHFESYKVQDVDAAIAGMIKNHSTMMDAIQTVLLNITAEFEQDSTLGCTKLQDFLIGISSVDKDGNIDFPTDARQVLRYMNAVLPIKWQGKRTTEAFSIVPDTARTKGFRFGNALKTMEASRWDRYGEKAKSAEFDADKTLQKALGMLKSIVSKHDAGELQDDDPAYVTARRYLKAA